jgi:hypothetical protein
MEIVLATVRPSIIALAILVYHSPVWCITITVFVCPIVCRIEMLLIASTARPPALRIIVIPLIVGSMPKITYGFKRGSEQLRMMAPPPD